ISLQTLAQAALVSYIVSGTRRNCMRLCISIRVSLGAAIMAALLMALPIPASAQGAANPCGKDVELRLTPANTMQGRLVRFEFRAASPLDKLKPEWAGRALPFCQAASRKHPHNFPRPLAPSHLH